jgi:hypothetical protein
MLPICTPFDGSDPAEETVVLMSFILLANWVDAGCRGASKVTIASTSENACRFQVSSARNLISMLPPFMSSSVVDDNHLAFIVRRDVCGSIGRMPE